jgi:site-specific recombinase XerD
MTHSEAAITRHLDHLRNRGLAAVYVDQRRRALRGLAHTLDRPVLDITADDLDRWQTTCLATRTTGRSRNTLVTHVREFYRWLHSEEITGDDRGRKLVRAKAGRLVPRPIGEGSLSVALQMAPPRVRPMLYLAAYEGLRACEIANLRREDVRDAETPATLVVLGKGSKERVLPASTHVLLELHAHGMPRRGPIFRMYDSTGHPTTRPITAHRVSATCNAYLAEVGAGASLHQLRHRFASQALRCSGGDLRLVQELLGHSSPATTAIYTEWATDRAAGVIEALATV